MSSQFIREKIEKLRKSLNHHNYLYYVLDSPEINDFEFDSLMKELILLNLKLHLSFQLDRLLNYFQ